MFGQICGRARSRVLANETLPSPPRDFKIIVAARRADQPMAG
jgi:hypothetical protein